MAMTSAERGRIARAKVADFVRQTVDYTARKHPVMLSDEEASLVEAWYSNPNDCGAAGKVTEVLARRILTGKLERVHGANRSDVSLTWLKKAGELKTGVFECTLHYETKAEADAVREAFLAGGKLFKCRGYLFFLPKLTDSHNIGGMRVISIAHFEAWLRNHPKAVIAKEATGGAYWTVSLQNYRASMKACEAFLDGTYYDGMDLATWIDLHGKH